MKIKPIQQINVHTKKPSAWFSLSWTDPTHTKNLLLAFPPAHYWIHDCPPSSPRVSTGRQSRACFTGGEKHRPSDYDLTVIPAEPATSETCGVRWGPNISETQSKVLKREKFSAHGLFFVTALTAPGSAVDSGGPPDGTHRSYFFDTPKTF